MMEEKKVGDKKGKKEKPIKKKKEKIVMKRSLSEEIIPIKNQTRYDEEIKT